MSKKVLSESQYLKLSELSYLDFITQENEKILKNKSLKEIAQYLLNEENKKDWYFEGIKGGTTVYEFELLLKEFINDNFQGRRQVLILVIDKSRLQSKISFDNEQETFTIGDRVNMDAILDKIIIKPNKEGVFDIEVSED